MTDEPIHTLTVEFSRLRPSQVLALRAMFDRWEWYGRAGASREVSFYVDGDGAFGPSINMESDLDEPLTGDRKDTAEISPNVFDFGPLVSEFRDDTASLEEADDD